MLVVGIILAFVFVVGLCIGSFLNVVILRGLSGESIVFPASKCPKCQHKLLWWHNIPVLSYIILGGKCGFCKDKISIQYPVIELITGLAFVLCVYKYGLTLDALFSIIFSCLFIVIATTDWKEKIVFDVHTYSLIGIGLGYALLATVIDMYSYYSLVGELAFTPQWIIGNHFSSALLGAIAGFLIMEIVARAGYLVAKGRAFGEGDSYIAAGLGAIFGWQTLLKLLVLSVVIQAIITIPMFLKKEFDNKNYLTVISLSAFILYALGFFAANQFGWLQNMTAYIICTIILVLIGIFTIREILSNIKDNKMYLPFGPALILAGFIMLLG